MWWREAGPGAAEVGMGKTLTSQGESVVNVVDGESLTDCTEKLYG